MQATLQTFVSISVDVFVDLFVDLCRHVGVDVCVGVCVDNPLNVLLKECKPRHQCVVKADRCAWTCASTCL